MLADILLGISSPCAESSAQELSTNLSSSQTESSAEEEPSTGISSQTESPDLVPDQTPTAPVGAPHMIRDEFVTQSCKDLTTSTAAFAQDVFNNAEEASLRPWRRGNWEIPTLGQDLFRSAFGGKTVVIVGDSTLAYFMNWVNNLMNGTTPELLNSLQNQTLTEGIQTITAYHNRRNAPMGGTGNNYTDYGGALILWLGYRGSNMHSNCLFHKRQWPAVRKLKPDVLLVNWGAHMLAKDTIKTCNIYQWIHYEKWLEEALDAAHEAGTKTLLFKTTNRICRGQGENPVQQCHKLVEALDPKLRVNPPHMQNVSQADKEKYCQEGLTNEEASVRLNARLMAYLPKAQERYPSMRIAVYNDHDMMHCSQTPDGIHYFPLNMPRVRLFAHMVNCLSG